MKLKTKLLTAAAALAVSAAATAQIWGPVVGGLINGGVLYGAGGVVAQDSTKFFWDGTNHRLGIGNAAPSTTLDVTGNTNITGTLGVSSAVTGGAASFSTIAASGLISPTSTIGIKGTVTNDNAPGGSIGEVSQGAVPIGSRITLTGLSGATTNITSISLTAGHWQIGGNCAYTGAVGAVIQQYSCGISTTSATLPTLDQVGQTSFSTAGTLAFQVGTISQPTPYVTMKLAGTTTVYLVQNINFTTSTPDVWGTITATRVR